MKKNETTVPGRIAFMRKLAIIYLVWLLAMGIMWAWIDIRNWPGDEGSANGTWVAINIFSLLGLIFTSLAGTVLSIVNSVLEARSRRPVAQSFICLLIFLTLPVMLVALNS